MNIENEVKVDTEDEVEISKYFENIYNVIERYQTQVKESNDNVTLADTAFLDVGKKLIEIEKIITDEHNDDKKKKKIFSKLKQKISKQITKNANNLDKVIKVAKFCDSDIYKEYQNRLPDGWGSIYLLFALKNDDKKFDENKFHEFMKDESIHKNMTRSELAKKILAFNNPDKSEVHKISITINGIAPTNEILRKLEKILKKECNNRFKMAPAPNKFTETKSDNPVVSEESNE